MEYRAGAQKLGCASEQAGVFLAGGYKGVAYRLIFAIAFTDICRYKYHYANKIDKK
jgi:hypothetical protein